MNLNGMWKLYFYDRTKLEVTEPSQLLSEQVSCIPGKVPGNVELDLSREGYLPEDLWKGENIRQAEAYEIYDFWYETSFTPGIPEKGEQVRLVFGGVDCIADYYLNGVKFASSDNMLIEQVFDVTALLRYEESNTLHVHILSPLTYVQAESYDPQAILYSWHQANVSKAIRKAPHGYGWDIMPRAVSAGIWRDVELKYIPAYHLKYYYFHVASLEADGSARIQLVLDAATGLEHAFATHKVIVKGHCGESRFFHSSYHDCGVAKLTFSIEQIQLWWPKNYGVPNIYDITIEIYDEKEQLILSKDIRQGFRKLELVRTDTVCEGGSFYFRINNQKIMTIGSNWVPMDAYHSRDKERYAKALSLADDIGCNILRCWGGNVYEDHAFFTFCEEHGILVWQDFAMACQMYPQDDGFAEKIKKEVTGVVQKLRNYACLVLWCGDNEIDQMIAGNGVNPSINTITRKTIPEILMRLDPCRPYIPSSPYISDSAFAHGRQYYPEDHLWGPRDYFKSSFYTGSNAYFVSETGYHGCPGRTSIEKFIDTEFVWPYQNNPQWNLHSSDQHNNDGRVLLMQKQIHQLFGTVPDDLDHFALASQISQAEAKKFFIERVRAKMDTMGGVIWWNLMDGWPQMSDAVVDYYYEKKLAYTYIKRSSYPVIAFIGKMEAWGYPVLAANNTLQAASGHLEIMDAETDQVLLDLDYTASPNSNTRLGFLPMMYSDKGMLILKYTVGEDSFLNTYLYGLPPFDLDSYVKWMEKAEDIERTR